MIERHFSLGNDKAELTFTVSEQRALYYGARSAFPHLDAAAGQLIRGRNVG